MIACPVVAAPERAAAIGAIAELMEALKLQSAFVGSVARAAWLGEPVESGSVDVLAVLAPERMRQVPMMASHRGFAVDPREIERAEELDLIPLAFGDVRIHVLMATNALYGRMVASSAEAQIADRFIRVVAPEDLALLLLMSDDLASVEKLLKAQPDLELESLNRRLASIGLGSRQVAR